MYDLLITNASVVTMDRRHRILSPGFVAVRGKTIAAVGPMEELSSGAGARRTIDGTRLAVLPGLIDAHGHAGHCLIRTLGEQSTHWISMANEIYDRFTDDFFWYADGALAAAERLKFGITTGVSMMGSSSRCDRVELLEAHFEGSLKTGIRQFAGLGCAAPPWPKTIRHWQGDSFREYEAHPRDAAVNARQALLRFADGHPRRFCIVAPSTMGRKAGMDDAFSAAENRTMHELSREFGVILHTHAYGGDVEFLHETTPKALCPSLSLTHCTGLSEREVSILAETGAWVLHGPTTRSVIRRRCPVYELLRAGARLAVVSDGTSPDRSFDLWREMKVFQVIHRAHEGDTMLAPPGMVLELCTIRAAEALGMGGQLGSLEPGKRADLITIDLNQPHLAPAPAPELLVQRLVYHAQGQDVRDVFVDGEQAVGNRRLLLCGEEEILRDADRAFADLSVRLGPGRMRRFTQNHGLYALRAESEF